MLGILSAISVVQNVYCEAENSFSKSFEPFRELISKSRVNM